MGYSKIHVSLHNQTCRRYNSLSVLEALLVAAQLSSLHSADVLRVGSKQTRTPTCDMLCISARRQHISQPKHSGESLV